MGAINLEIEKKQWLMGTLTIKIEKVIVNEGH